MCCFNAYIIYKKDKGHLDRLHFLIECVEKLVDNNIVKTHPKTSTSSSTSKPSCLLERHFPEQMKSDIGKTKSRKCRVCYKKGVRKESTYWCSDCKVALCINSYFEEPIFGQQYLTFCKAKIRAQHFLMLQWVSETLPSK